jgi:hypothetical protein
MEENKTPEAQEPPKEETYTKADLDRARVEGHKSAFSDTLSTIDRRLQQELGIEKPEGEKTIDFVLNQLKSTRQQAQEPKETKPDPEIMGKLQQMEKLLQEKEQALQALTTQAQQAQFKSSVSSDVEAFVSTLPDQIKEMTRQMITSKLMDVKTSTSNGKVVFVGDEGQYLASNDAKSTKSVGEWIQDNFGQLATLGTPPPKTKTTKAEQKTMSLQEKERVAKDFEGVTDKATLNEYMRNWSKETGHIMGSQQYREKRGELLKDLGIE